MVKTLTQDQHVAISESCFVQLHLNTDKPSSGAKSIWGDSETRQAEEEVGRQHQGKDRPGVCLVPEGSGEQGKMEETGCEIICSAPMTLAVKG